MLYRHRRHKREVRHVFLETVREYAEKVDSSENLDFWLKQFIYPNHMSMFYIILHAVLALLMLQIYRTGITFIYTVRFVGDRWDEGEVARS